MSLFCRACLSVDRYHKYHKRWAKLVVKKDRILLAVIRKSVFSCTGTYHYFDGLVQERHNSSMLAMVLCLSSTNPLMCTVKHCRMCKQKDCPMLLFHSISHMSIAACRFTGSLTCFFNWFSCGQCIPLMKGQWCGKHFVSWYHHMGHVSICLATCTFFLKCILVMSMNCK